METDIKGSANVDAFLTPSNYYKDLFISKTGISGDNFHVIPLGFDPGDLYQILKKEIIGHQSDISAGSILRMDLTNWLMPLLNLNRETACPDLLFMFQEDIQVMISHLYAEQIRKIKASGLKSFVRIYPEFQGNSKQEFFSNIDVMSVPVRKHDGYGLYILEANAAGVPVVQPATGAFPEIIERTGVE